MFLSSIKGPRLEGSKKSGALKMSSISCDNPGVAAWRDMLISNHHNKQKQRNADKNRTQIRVFHPAWKYRQPGASIDEKLRIERPQRK